MSLAVEALVSDRRSWGEEEAAGDHGGDEGETEEDEGVLLEEAAIALADGSEAAGGGVGGGVGFFGEDAHCVSGETKLSFG